MFEARLKLRRRPRRRSADRARELFSKTLRAEDNQKKRKKKVNPGLSNSYGETEDQPWLDLKDH